MYAAAPLRPIPLHSMDRRAFPEATHQRQVPAEPFPLPAPPPCPLQSHKQKRRRTSHGVSNWKHKETKP
ncbi:hypothetical protein BAE44_0019007 [Dichanthelium oligosanthes]|uniref:Uncharacterized protein n=1 Tax=Dichanthelium oligosanthes TaxID=888268 RepID=A0A1E5V4K6_9POAL|nr:hypothetical protein BAE44_0019007 [Dichanthelium oligosanthes]